MLRAVPEEMRIGLSAGVALVLGTAGISSMGFDSDSSDETVVLTWEFFCAFV